MSEALAWKSEKVFIKVQRFIFTCGFLFNLRYKTFPLELTRCTPSRYSG